MIFLIVLRKFLFRAYIFFESNISKEVVWVCTNYACFANRVDKRIRAGVDITKPAEYQIDTNVGRIVCRTEADAYAATNKHVLNYSSIGELASILVPTRIPCRRGG